MHTIDNKNDISSLGFCVINNIYSACDIDDILDAIKTAGNKPSTFRKSDDLFAIRQFLKMVPDVRSIILNDNLKKIIREIFSDTYFVVKSIYFDKPSKSNWFVPWHQDLTISVNQKKEVKGYGPWTIKQNQFAVKPPTHILKDNFTIRIHLDDADAENGALKVLPASHLKGVYRTDGISWINEKAHTCCVNAGGIMIMRPLMMHASDRTVNNKPRKVIHIEFSRSVLPDGIDWSEKLCFF
ncbi:phytanoyl-CoA dioxygenase family protein [Mucilaginibacter litoreus]|uniref:Phytanoyl-CoA dioxygenase family protein n=1 Tax=Mucilaginibacter litoreus TaxID=1048221 RepID=A0ABW3AUI6_9SPHI